MRLVTFAFVCLTALAGNVFPYRVTGPTSGINSATGERPARQDIRVLETSGRAWDLYIQALQRFQAADQQALLSWFQVAGIHGRPYIPWDGVNGRNERGYCTHGSVIFPTWHRPYLALYEQIIWNHTQTIASEYPSQSRQSYQTAADSFRIPYWDWASSAAIPGVLSSSQITINTPQGSRTIDNPLFRYNFRRPPGTSDASLGQFSDAAFTTRDDSAQSALLSNAGNLRDSTFNLLTRQRDYLPFSNNAATASRGNRFASIEGIHDLIHGAIGGWMGFIPYSAFDPIFFLHHANVDRIFAIWQAIYPNSFVRSQINRSGTFTNRPGGTEDVNTPLTPFHSNDGTGLYTSTSARFTRTFGYTVPEVRDWGVSPQELSANTLATVQRLYGPNTQQLAPRGVNTFSARRKRQAAAPTDGSYTVPASLGKNGTSANGTSDYPEWFANISVDKFALGTPFYVHFFIGDVPSDPASWLSGISSFVGTFVSFTNPAMSEPEADVELTIFGQVPLTRRLIELYNNGVIPDLEVYTMREYLRDNLQWRAQLYDQSEIPLSALPSLGIFVVNDADVSAGNSTDLEPVPEITDGRTGGADL